MWFPFYDSLSHSQETPLYVVSMFVFLSLTWHVIGSLCSVCCHMPNPSPPQFTFLVLVYNSANNFI